MKRLLTLLTLWGCSILGCGGAPGGGPATDAADESPSDVAQESPADIAMDPPGDAATDGPGDAADADGSGSAALPIGTLTGLGSHPCATGAPAAARCQQMTVRCPGVEDIGAQVAVTDPAGAPLGTVFLIFGGGGTTYFDQGFPAAYLANNLQVVQVLFGSAWEASSANSIKAAACRVATLADWAFNNPHGARRDTAFCLHGHSGGSGGVGYTMSHYGGDAYVDYVMFDAGPVFGRMDYGCDPALYGDGSGRRYVCPDMPSGTFAYSNPGGIPLIDTWEGTTTCGTASPPTADIARWADDSVVSTGGDYDYPQTDVSFWECASSTSNEAAGQGSFVADTITSPHTFNCVAGMCTEPAWTVPGGFDQMVAAMAAGCVPRH